MRSALALPSCVLVVCKEDWHGKGQYGVDKRYSFAFVAAFIPQYAVLCVGISVSGAVCWDRYRLREVKVSLY